MERLLNRTCGVSCSKRQPDVWSVLVVLANTKTNTNTNTKAIANANTFTNTNTGTNINEIREQMLNGTCEVSCSKRHGGRRLVHTTRPGTKRDF